MWKICSKKKTHNIYRTNRGTNNRVNIFMIINRANEQISVVFGWKFIKIMQYIKLQLNLNYLY